MKQLLFLINDVKAWIFGGGSDRFLEEFQKELVGEHDSVSEGGRGVLEREAPFIAQRDYGLIRLGVKEGEFVAADGTGLRMEDLYEHLICFGGSGTGKTYSVLQPLWEECFRSTHLRRGVEREVRKFGGLVIEAKGDFKEKTLILARKYGRTSDVILFGPRHSVVYDPFGDPHETEMQQASKLLELMKAMSGGRAGEDPFWENAARKLFLHIFLLHRAVKQGMVELPEEEPPPPAMSFALLNLMLMDRGQARNGSEWAQSEKERHHLESQFREEVERLSASLLRLDMLHAHLIPFSSESSVQAFLKGCTTDQMKASDVSMPMQCDRLRQALRRLVYTEADASPASAGAFLLGEGLRQRFSLLPELCRVTGQSLAEVTQTLTVFIESTERFLRTREQLLSFQPVKPEFGVLRNLLDTYKRILEVKNISPSQDPVASYFHEEYWNMANDRTSGSIAMTASNVVAPLAHPPFDRIFGPQATFTFSDVIDSGRIVYLDMPSADYKKGAEVAALVMKMDFFRTMLRRSRLRCDDGREVNQERPMVYFCDEFATVASSGDDTGEAGFLDKVREFRCACILGVQSLPMLYRKLDENEVDALLTNTAIKIFLNNTDVRTNAYAGKVFGNEIKVTGSLQSMESDRKNGDPAHWQTQHTIGERVRPGDFALLKRGQAYVRLNPRFEENQMRKVSFLGRPL